jgi:hypothetical protein
VLGRRTSALKEKTRQASSPAPEGSGEVEELKDQVGVYLEVCDSLLGEWTPESIIDLLHLLVRSLNFDVVSLVLLDSENTDQLSRPASRGYKSPPNSAVVECWERSIVESGIDWKKLMRGAENKKSDLAYWVVYEGLQSIGYVPIRDSFRIYGFLLVGAHGKDFKPSPLASDLLDACGGRIGLSLALKQARGDWPDTVLNMGSGIRDQFTLLMGYMELLKDSASLSQDELTDIVGKCDQALLDCAKILDSMTTAATGEEEEG